jgi:hypothetical protein
VLQLSGALLVTMVEVGAPSVGLLEDDGGLGKGKGLAGALGFGLKL